MAELRDAREVRRRLHTLCEALPQGASVTFTRADFLQLLGVEERLPEARRDLTTNEVAELFEVRPQTVLAWLHEGRFGIEGSGWYRLGRRYYVRRKSLAELGSRQAQVAGALRLRRNADQR